MFKISYHRKEEVYMRPLVYKKPDWVTVYGDLKIDWFKTYFWRVLDTVQSYNTMIT